MFETTDSDQRSGIPGASDSRPTMAGEYKRDAGRAANATFILAGVMFFFNLNNVVVPTPESAAGGDFWALLAACGFVVLLGIGINMLWRSAAVAASIVALPWLARALVSLVSTVQETQDLRQVGPPLFWVGCFLVYGVIAIRRGIRSTFLYHRLFSEGKSN